MQQILVKASFNFKTLWGLPTLETGGGGGKKALLPGATGIFWMPPKVWVTPRACKKEAWCVFLNRKNHLTIALFSKFCYFIYIKNQRPFFDCLAMLDSCPL
jgi:hypothetical protein